MEDLSELGGKELLDPSADFRFGYLEGLRESSARVAWPNGGSQKNFQLLVGADVSFGDCHQDTRLTCHRLERERRPFSIMKTEKRLGLGEDLEDPAVHYFVASGEIAYSHTRFWNRALGVENGGRISDDLLDRSSFVSTEGFFPEDRSRGRYIDISEGWLTLEEFEMGDAICLATANLIQADTERPRELESVTLEEGQICLSFSVIFLENGKFSEVHTSRFFNRGEIEAASVSKEKRDGFLAQVAEDSPGVYSSIGTDDISGIEDLAKSKIGEYSQVIVENLFR